MMSGIHEPASFLSLLPLVRNKHSMAYGFARRLGIPGLDGPSIAYRLFISWHVAKIDYDWEALLLGKWNSESGRGLP